MSKDTCFVIMPYGVKQDVDGNEIDFDEVYRYLIREAVEEAGLECVRCDDIEAPGLIHDRMLKYINSARVAIVDTSTLNANVFYELGIRHTLHKSVTVLIHKKGTTWPFNIAGLSSIEYDTGLKAAEEAKQKITRFITNALADSDLVDSLVYEVLDDLNVSYGQPIAPKPVLDTVVLDYPLRADPARSIGLVAGDRQSLRVGDVWVNSENTNMQMDRYFGRSTSATIRYLGAEKHPVTGRVVHDTVSDELGSKMAGEVEVDPGTVIDTGAGELESTNNVKLIFHVASVIGQPREGYRPIERLDRCVTNALAHAGRPQFSDLELRSMVFPVFGTGPGGQEVRTQLAVLADAAISYLESGNGPIERVSFYIWSDFDLASAKEVLEANERLSAG